MSLDDQLWAECVDALAKTSSSTIFRTLFMQLIKLLCDTKSDTFLGPGYQGDLDIWQLNPSLLAWNPCTQFTLSENVLSSIWPRIFYSGDLDCRWLWGWWEEGERWRKWGWLGCLWPRRWRQREGNCELYDDGNGDEYGDDDGLSVYDLPLGDNEKVNCMLALDALSSTDSWIRRRQRYLACIPDPSQQRKGICCSVSTTPNIPIQKLRENSKCSFNDHHQQRHHDNQKPNIIITGGDLDLRGWKWGRRNCQLCHPACSLWVNKIAKTFAPTVHCRCKYFLQFHHIRLL